MENIKVIAQFDGPKVKPIYFKKNDRVYKVDKLNLVHHYRQGEQTIFNFHVSNQTGSYKLRFEPETMQWFLEDEYPDI